MVTVPEATPVTTPDVIPTTPMAVLALVHVPPVVVEASVVEAPTVVIGKPDMAAGKAFTVTVLMLRQPVPIEYVMFVTPADEPATTPVAGAMAATALLALFHVPPEVVLLNVIELLIQKLIKPVLLVLAGNAAFTVTTAVLKHPEAFVYEIVAVPVA